MNERDRDGGRFGRRKMLQLSAAAGVAAAIPGCDGETPVEMMDGGPLPMDGGPRPMRDAGPDPIPPIPRTYETFEHGVASGDPWADSVLLWTRVTPGMPGTEPASVELSWELASDPAFADVLDSGDGVATAERDYTFKVVADGLEPATTYYYRFEAMGVTSPIGRARTLPSGDADRFRFAFCSCSSLGHGFFHAYRRIAERADLDVVLHLGDYIYEYGSGRYGRVREYDPGHDIVSLEDYRTRYSQYRRDPDLAEVHRQHSFICVWDDHETADDSWREGASNHDPATQGPWSERLEVAWRTYRDWMPVREQEELQLWRTFSLGSLADLIMLDTRIWGREEQGTDPTHLLGADQEAWLFEQLRESTARYKIIGQQIVMGQWIGLFNEDAWDGYPEARDRLFAFIRDEGIENVVVLTGDVHSSWAMDLTEDPTDEVAYDPATGEGSLGVELVTPAISSQGFVGILVRAAETIREQSPHIHWVNGDQRGYVVVDVTPERVQGDWFFVEDVEREGGAAERHAISFATAHGANHLEEEAEPSAPRSSPPALAPSPS